MVKRAPHETELSGKTLTGALGLCASTKDIFVAIAFRSITRFDEFNETLSSSLPNVKYSEDGECCLFDFKNGSYIRTYPPNRLNGGRVPKSALYNMIIYDREKEPANPALDEFFNELTVTGQK